VSLSASDTQADNGELVTFRATASDSVTGTGYVIQIVNPDTGFVHRQCATGTTCSVGGRRENTTARYQALVARPDGSDVQARSRIRTVTWSGGSSGGSSGSAWDVDLSTSDQTASNGEFVRITARSNRDVGGTGYAIQVFNPETGFIHWSCSSGTTCGGRASRQNTTAPYRARISAPNGSDVQAQSDTQTVTWQ
jgi:hypothetical protein